ncbi:hypothetical protein CIK00_01835 [Photobacterium carnosum]|uniref:Uncharacterized protein n=1 Tax=Photobacterium carnosum TaxID=2023717 RepID=A0A2N4UXR8_9GAMM|nr:hypothetical protein CIK00_01835 [Photobacterium carnosum]
MILLITVANAGSNLMTKTIHSFLGSVSTLLLIAKYQMRKYAPKSITYNAILLLQIFYFKSVFLYFWMQDV